MIYPSNKFIPSSNNWEIVFLAAILFANVTQHFLTLVCAEEQRETSQKNCCEEDQMLDGIEIT